MTKSETQFRASNLTESEQGDIRRLKKLFDEKAGLSQKDFGARWGIGSPGMMSQYLTGKRSLGLAAAIKFAKGLGVELADISPTLAAQLPAASLMEASNVSPAPIGTRRVPLISYVQAGCWTEATDPATVGDGFEYLLTDLELSGSAFALQIEGESMLPQFRPGDRVIVDPEICPQPGDCVVAMNGGHEATFKKYRPRGMDEAGNVVFELIPLNEDFAPMRSDQTPIRIVGTMMEHRQYRRRA